MKKGVNKQRVRSFLFRRKANLMGLLAITGLSVVVTVAFALLRSPRTGVLVCVTALLFLLCAVQLYRMRSSYRTIPSFRGFRKKRKRRDV